MNRLVALSLLFALVAVLLGTPGVSASKGVLAEDPTGDQSTWSLGRLVLRDLKKYTKKKGKGKKKKVRIYNLVGFSQKSCGTLVSSFFELNIYFHGSS